MKAIDFIKLNLDIEQLDAEITESVQEFVTPRRNE